jgi:excisionase family DNA binding protein
MTYFTPVEVARRIHRRTSLVYMLLRTGELPFYQMPGARGILVSENDLDEFMRRYRISGGKAIQKLVEVQKCSA